jgi:hypothetical protein
MVHFTIRHMFYKKKTSNLFLGRIDTFREM